MAQTTGIINASSIRVFLDTDGDIATPAYVVVDHVTECSISVNVDMRDITTKTSQGFRESLPGLRSASLSLSVCLQKTQRKVTTTLLLHNCRR